jgi:DNA repair protein RecN (Recombination protein N)
MLTDLHIRNLAIVTDLHLECERGMTAITGETGAGKSILIDALSLALGERADSSLVRPGTARAEITLQFDLAPLPHVKTWLHEHELSQGEECIIRRTINADGRSRAFINDQPVTLVQMRELGSFLLDIHGQHAYHSLLNPDTHITMLDNFAGHTALLSSLRDAYSKWHKTDIQLKQLQRSTEERQSRLELLQFQLEELGNLGLEQQPWEQVVSEHQKLANAEQLSLQASQVLEHLSSEQEANALTLLQQASLALEKISAVFPDTKGIAELLKNSHIQAQEASHDLLQFVEQIVIDPQQLAELDKRLSAMHTIARKLRCAPEQLTEHYAALQQEHETLLHADENQEALKIQLAEFAKEYTQWAKQLTASRQKAAAILSQSVTAQLPKLALPHALFTVSLKEKDGFSALGQESAEFIVQTNPGHPAQPLAKIASGGELSRISLAIQVVTAQTSPTPVLVFDEVDVGISGGTASMVGELLKQLSWHAQILCVTHQPQVAVYSDQHWFVKKTVKDDHTATQIVSLTENERVNEIARLLGGITITEQTMAHAKELLQQSQKSMEAVA